MPSSSLNQASPIAKTAFDALQAKASALDVGYAPMMVHKNHLRYEQLVDQVTRASSNRKRRQTPLVNAGYACRVRAMSNVIQAFVTYHQQVQKAAKIQIVLLGCGADVIGLWAHSLGSKSCDILIYELDMPEVCQFKQPLLVEHDMVSPIVDPGDSTCSQDPPVSSCFEGVIRHPSTTAREGRDDANEDPPTTPNYFLCPVDLRDIRQLEDLFGKRQNSDYGSLLWDDEAPTLVVSELVLAYLTPDETDALLCWCSSTLCQSPGCAMVALEPLGGGDSCENEIYPSELVAVGVLEGYQREYCRQFRSKMERGLVKKNDINSNQGVDSGSFFPIAKSCQHAESRFSVVFESAHAVHLGTGASYTSCSEPFAVSEVFDEHAALTCHLLSYVVLNAFPKGTDGVLQRLMCQGTFVSGRSEIPPTLYPNSDIVYTVIEGQDEEVVRNLFRNTYVSYFDQYPAIRKMVKATLNRELAIECTTGSSDSAGLESSIASRYWAMGGCFFVALKYGENDREDGSGAESGSTVRRRYVIGCVGIRSCERRDKPGSLEIFRLSVDKRYRGQGIGRSLIEVAEAFAKSRAWGCPKIVANTLTILDAAKRLYEAGGYQCEKEAGIGSLTMKTYVKELPDY